MKHRLAPILSLAAALLLLGTGAALAQDTSIAGVVTDATGGVLPGVTVEVASPALIEGVRTVVTDGTGRYSATQLRPGTYSVTFTLSGFAVVRREGVILTTGFSAPVNAEMKVGSLEETVTVTGASPTVDVQNVRTQQTLARETLDTLPNAQTLSSIASLTLGVKVTAIVQQDVGGNQGEMGAVSVHNARTVDQKISMEGMNTNNSMGTNGGVFHAGQHYNMEAFQEVTLAHTGMGADTETAGAQINYVPKDGGNKFSGSARATYVNDDWQSDNLTDALKARGATTPPKIKRVYDGGGAVGGPIKRDKLWFYTAHRWWGDQTYQPGTFYNATQGTPVYTADLNRPGYLENYNKDNSIRLTWQASGADKIALYQNFGNQCVCYLGVSSTFAPEAAGHNGTPENRLTQVTWNRVQTNKLLFEGGFTYLHNPFAFNHEDRPGVAPGTGRQGVGYDAIPMIELAPFRIFNARIPGFLPYTDCQGPAPACGLSPAGQQNGRFSVSYVTGSHSFKAGFSMAHGRVDVNGQGNAVPGFGPAYFTLLFGRPIAVTLAAQPNYARSDFRNTGFYVQDQWSIRNLTLNIGGRFDMFDGWSPDQTYPGGAFVPSFSITRIDKTPTWRDFSPRFGAAYDVAGDGKTALKFSAGRYVGAAGAGTVQPTNPINAIVSSATRPWFDADGDFFPDANELGPLDNAAFGTVVQNTLFDPDYLTENRAYTWQISGGVERELTDNIGVSLNYFRTMHFNQIVTDNTLVTPADFDTFSVVVPAGLPNAGQTVSGLATPSLATFGKFRNLVRNEKTFGNQTEVYDGVDVALRTRFVNGAILQGGVSVGKTVDDHCFVVDSPQALHFCKVETPWWDGNGQIKLAGSYPIPGGVELSAVYQNLPGLPISANVQYTNADIRPSLGRNLPTATVTIPLLEPNTVFEDRINQVDFRVAKVFRGSFGRLRATIDLYNAFNSSTILGRNDTFVAASGGAGWGNPTRILGGRLVKWYAQYYF